MNDAPRNTVSPSITTEGSKIILDVGSWSNSPTHYSIEVRVQAINSCGNSDSATVFMGLNSEETINKRKSQQPGEAAGQKD